MSYPVRFNLANNPNYNTGGDAHRRCPPPPQTCYF